MNTYELDPLKLKPDKRYLEDIISHGIGSDLAPAGVQLGSTFEASVLYMEICQVARRILARIDKRIPPPSYRVDCIFAHKVHCKSCTELWAMDYRAEVAACHEICGRNSQPFKTIPFLRTLTSLPAGYFQNWARHNILVTHDLNGIYTPSFMRAFNYIEILTRLEAYEHFDWDGK